ncbi:hypothetical protein [Nodosilinea sp. LEGE 07298]|uniref:hypothetical protein n=1 Tax=Nodosilinea sp. LEGE 07298 TaxID=2777970 RepID=UPI001D1430BD
MSESSEISFGISQNHPAIQQRPNFFPRADLIDRYSYCQLGMTPQRFYAKWQMSQEDMAAICPGRSRRCGAGGAKVAAIAALLQLTCAI